MIFNPTYKPFGDSAILIEWPSKIDTSILNDITDFKAIIKKQIEVKDCIVGYNSILLVYKFIIIDVAEKINFLQELYRKKKSLKKHKSTHWQIPVCYDAVFGIDLESISKKLNLEIKDVIQLHTAAIYTVYFVGFLPGFLYLGGLNNQLAIPRKATPRLTVPKGAVAIGGNQTGVYPNESSGGWHIIGNSPIQFFDTKKQSPCFAKTGDKITFKNVSVEEYKHIKEQVDSNSYQLKSIK